MISIPIFCEGQQGCHFIEPSKAIRGIVDMLVDCCHYRLQGSNIWDRLGCLAHGEMEPMTNTVHRHTKWVMSLDESSHAILFAQHNTCAINTKSLNLKSYNTNSAKNINKQGKIDILVENSGSGVTTIRIFP